jgi:hypothetical protein
VQVGIHFAGPTWQSTVDNSQVAGMAIGNSPSPMAGNIPWLLLKAKSHMGQGVLSGVTYVQRVDTSGGVAPATGCNAATVGTDQAVPYSANYYFYTGGDSPDAAAADSATTD